MLVKTAPARVKTITDADAEGTFEALVSVFGNVDSVGDVVMPGAFKDTLGQWRASGDPIPVLWSHNSSDPDYHIGEVLEAEERPEGLWVKAQLDIEGPGKARQAYRLLKGRRVTQFSFAYDVLDGAPAEREGEQVFELRRLKLYEVGPTLIGANQETRLLGAKTDDAAAPVAAEAMARLVAEVKAGRVLSSANEKRIRAAVDELAAVLSALDKNDDDGKTTAGAPAKDESGDAKSEEPTHRSLVPALSDLLALELDLAER